MSLGTVVIAAMLFSLAIVVVMITLYLRYQHRLTTEQLRQQEQEIDYQKKLIQVTVQSQEEERKRIGQDLHDNVGTALSRLRLVMESYDHDEEADERKKLLYQSGKQIIATVVKDVRDISHQLSPTILNLCGLEEALLDIADQLNVAGKLQLHIHNDAKAIVEKLPEQTSIAIYRTVQELLSNTIKHAQAQNVNLSFRQTADQLTITYADDGVGIAKDKSDKPGMGLKNIASRIIAVNGNFKIDEAVKGFTMHINLPYHGNE